MWSVRFHVTRIAVLLATLSIAGVTAVQAKCIARPEIRATAVVRACVGVTFGASRSKYAIGAGDPWPMYKPGETLSGTLLTVSVKSARFVWNDALGHRINGARLWAKGETRSLFVASDAAEACGSVLPAEITVETQPVCCDEFPGGWECLLPRTVARVAVITE